MVARLPRRRPLPARAVPAAFAAAIAVHLVVFLVVDVSYRPPDFAAAEAAAAAARATAAAPAEPDLESSCGGDAALAAASRAAVCMSPFGGELAGCLAGVDAAWREDRARCATDAEPMAIDVVTLTPEDIARIDPEPLLEILSAAEQLAFEDKQAQQVAALEQAEQKRQEELATRQAQVIETVRPAVEVAPDEARFLSDYDTKTDKETVARGSRKEEMIARSRPEELPTKADAREPSVAEPPPPDQITGANPEAPMIPGKLSMRSPGALAPSTAAQVATVRGRADGVTGPAADGVAARRGDGTIEQPRRDPDPVHGGGGAGGGMTPVPDLHPSKDVLERALGGGSVDYLEDVDAGDETALNSRHWVYASFFNRLKRQVAQNWEPGEVWRRHDPTGTVYGFKSRVTQLRVTLDHDGKLARAPTIVGASGVDVLDDEAVRAFSAAAPFPNPPDGLVRDGEITFEFSFHFEIGAPRTSWRVLRQM